MGTYNTTLAVMKCLRCDEVSEIEVDLYFGDTSEMTFVKLGDAYPMGGEVLERGEGYAECPRCERDFFCEAVISKGVLVGVEANTTRAPYVPDAFVFGEVACGNCSSTNTEQQGFRGIDKVRVICEDCGALIDGALDFAS